MRRFGRATAVLALALCVFAGCRSGNGSTGGSAAPSTSSTAAVASPAASGELSVYAALTQENGDALAKAFSAA